MLESLEYGLDGSNGKPHSHLYQMMMEAMEGRLLVAER